MKKRKLKNWVKESILMSLMIAVGLISIMAMCVRAENLDQKKELSLSIETQR